jgi:hypothetical protein
MLDRDRQYIYYGLVGGLDGVLYWLEKERTRLGINRTTPRSILHDFVVHTKRRLEEVRTTVA